MIVRKGKGLKDRTVPLPSRVFNLLEDYVRYMTPDDRVFNVKPVAISDKIRRIANKAGVKIHAHSLRHGYATRLLEKGANIKAVQELLGHSRIGTTEAYLSLLPKHLREAVDLLDNVPAREARNAQKEPKESDESVIKSTNGKTYRIVKPQSVRDVYIPPTLK